MDNFLAASEYIDFGADNIQALASELLSDGMSDIPIMVLTIGMS